MYFSGLRHVYVAYYVEGHKWFSVFRQHYVISIALCFEKSSSQHWHENFGESGVEQFFWPIEDAHDQNECYYASKQLTSMQRVASFLSQCWKILKKSLISIFSTPFSGALFLSPEKREKSSNIVRWRLWNYLSDFNHLFRFLLNKMFYYFDVKINND